MKTFYVAKWQHLRVIYWVHLEESYGSLKTALNMTWNVRHNRIMGRDLKILVLAQQQGYPKLVCFILNGTTEPKLYIGNWPAWKGLEIWKKNVLKSSFKSHFTATFAIELGVIKKVVKVVCEEGETLKYLATNFPNLFKTVLKERIFTRPDITLNKIKRLPRN